MALTDRDKLILQLEASWWQNHPSKSVAIEEELGISTSYYYELLARILDDPEAFVEQPLVVHRLKKQRLGRHALKIKDRTLNHPHR
jgi:hypothetical protein